MKREAMDWWESLPIEKRQDYAYHYCTHNEISVMHEFDSDCIVEIYKSEK